MLLRVGTVRPWISVLLLVVNPNSCRLELVIRTLMRLSLDSKSLPPVPLMTTPKLLPRALLYLLNFLQGFLYHLSNVCQQNSNALSALKSRNSTSLLIGQSMYMKMFSRSPVHSLIAESPSHSNERPIGLDTRMNDTDSLKIGLAACRTAIIHAIAKT